MYLRTFSSLINASQRCFLRSVDVSKFHSLSNGTHNFSIALSKGALANQKHFTYIRRQCFSQASASVGKENVNKHNQEVIIKGTDVPKACQSFGDINLEEHVLLELKKLGFTTPTTIQEHCLPVALSGRDMVGIGQTGSGKTLAYVLPALSHIKNQGRPQSGQPPTVLILAPTRELVQQIQGVVHLFHDICRIKCASLYGGVSKGPQAMQIENGVHLCIATPGRLIDLCEMGVLNLSQISYLVIDEADRMLDMGFEPQVREIIRKITGKHQTLMWSATWPREVEGLAKEFMGEAVNITVGSTALTANPNITQTVDVCQPHEKQERLFDYLDDILSEKKNKVLIFAETKRRVDELTADLIWKRKIRSASSHGDKTQLQRDKALNDFRRNIVRVLLATDVAARGLDITDITHVINYDFPREIESYVHRIGRTARAQRTGSAHTFFTEENGALAKELVHILLQNKQEVNPDLLEIAESTGHRKKTPSNFQGSVQRDRNSSFFNKTSSFRNKSFERYPRGQTERRGTYNSNRRSRDSLSSYTDY